MWYVANLEVKAAYPFQQWMLGNLDWMLDNNAFAFFLLHIGYVAAFLNILNLCFLICFIPESPL